MTSTAPITSRDAILDAAIRCFAAKGFAATTIKDLAWEADVKAIKAPVLIVAGDADDGGHARQ